MDAAGFNWTVLTIVGPHNGLIQNLPGRAHLEG